MHFSGEISGEILLLVEYTAESPWILLGIILYYESKTQFWRLNLMALHVWLGSKSYIFTDDWFRKEVNISDPEIKTETCMSIVSTFKWQNNNHKIMCTCSYMYNVLHLRVYTSIVIFFFVCWAALIWVENKVNGNFP